MSTDDRTPDDAHLTGEVHPTLDEAAASGASASASDDSDTAAAAADASDTAAAADTDAARPEFAGEPSADRAHPSDGEARVAEAEAHQAGEPREPASTAEAAEYGSPEPAVAEYGSAEPAASEYGSAEPAAEEYRPAEPETAIEPSPIAEPLAPASDVFDLPATPQVAPRWEAPSGSVADDVPAVHSPEPVAPAAAPAEPARASATLEPATPEAIAPGAATPEAAAPTPAPSSPVDNGAIAYPAAAFIPPPAPFAPPAPQAGDDDRYRSAGSTAAPIDDAPAGSERPSAAAAATIGTAAAAAGAGTATAGAGAAAAANTAYPPANFAPPVAIAVPILTPPKRRSNRGFGILITLLATLVFAIVYAAAGAAILAFTVQGSRLMAVVGQFAASPAFYVPVIFFALALAITVVIVNRAGWWAYVLGGFLIAVVVYGAAILGALLAVKAWTMSAEDITSFLRSLVMDPLTLAAALVAREVPIWAGAWIAAHGRRLKAKNIAAREEYERKLAETPVAQYPTGVASS